MSSIARVLTSTLSATALCVAMAAPAAAASFFTFEMAGTFDTEIGGETVDQEFVLSGRTTTALTGTPWAANPVNAPVAMDSLTLTYDGTDIGATLSSDAYFFGNLVSPATPNNPAIFTFNETAGGIDFRPATPQDSIVFQTTFGGVDTWIGFGGTVTDEPGIGGRNMGITTELTGDAVDFKEDTALDIRLGAEGETLRTATLQPIPLPAAGWMMLAALGGLVAMGRRRQAGAAA